MNAIENRNIIVFDSNFVCNMYKYVFRRLSSDEQSTGIIFGFLSEILKYAKQFRTNRFVFCWDDWKSSKRRDVYPAYKANRIEKHAQMSPDDRNWFAEASKQFNMLREEVLPTIGFNNNFLLDGLEGDDAIASVVANNQQKGNFIVIATDRDLYQLLSYCSILNTIKKQMLTEEWLISEYGISPKLWGQMKIIAGCQGDNIAGISGIGEKTAIKFLRGETIGESKHKKILSSRRSIHKINAPLVLLPHSETPALAIQDDGDFYADNFLSICNKFNLKLFQRKYKDWDGIFDFK